jgi:hypothetical protein
MNNQLAITAQVAQGEVYKKSWIISSFFAIITLQQSTISLHKPTTLYFSKTIYRPSNQSTCLDQTVDVPPTAARAAAAPTADAETRALAMTALYVTFFLLYAPLQRILTAG